LILEQEEERPETREGEEKDDGGRGEEEFEAVVERLGELTN